jgi:hypothetical protein
MKLPTESINYPPIPPYDQFDNDVIDNKTNNDLEFNQSDKNIIDNNNRSNNTNTDNNLEFNQDLIYKPVDDISVHDISSLENSVLDIINEDIAVISSIEVCNIIISTGDIYQIISTDSKLLKLYEYFKFMKNTNARECPSCQKLQIGIICMNEYMYELQIGIICMNKYMYKLQIGITFMNKYMYKLLIGITYRSRYMYRYLYVLLYTFKHEYA